MRFSIIVPVYKVQYDKLKDCISSLVNQDYKDYEIILVDDGSPDKCPIICEEFAQKYKNIKVIHQENKGLSGARNTGVKNAKCDYYTFVDGDDKLVPNALTIANKYLNMNVDVLCSRLKPCSEYEDIGEYPYEFSKIYSTADELNYLKKKLIDFKGNNNSACGKFYKYKLTTDKALYHDENLKQGAEDLEFNFRFFSNSKQIAFMREIIYECVYNENSITRSFNLKNQYLILDCFEKIKNNIDKKDIDLMNTFYGRLKYVMVSTAISGFFNPKNKLSFKEQKKEYNDYINTDLFKRAIKSKTKLDKKRAIILFCIKHHFYLFVKFFALIRYYQKRK